MNDDRKEELEFAIGAIYSICNEFNMALIPCKTKNGTDCVGIWDNTTGQRFVMIKGE